MKILIFPCLCFFIYEHHIAFKILQECPTAVLNDKNHLKFYLPKTAVIYFAQFRQDSVGEGLSVLPWGWQIDSLLTEISARTATWDPKSSSTWVFQSWYFLIRLGVFWEWLFQVICCKNSQFQEMRLGLKSWNNIIFTVFYLPNHRNGFPYFKRRNIDFHSQWKEGQMT